MESGVSGRLADILVKHAAQTIPAQHQSGLRGCYRCLLPRRALAQALVRPGLLVMLDELPQNVLEVAATKDPSIWSSTSLRHVPTNLCAIEFARGARGARYGSRKTSTPSERKT